MLFVSLLVMTTGAEADNMVVQGNPTTAKTQAMTLMQLTGLALRRNPKTRSGWAAIRASEAGLELARAGYWPQINATLAGQRNRALIFPANSPISRHVTEPCVSLGFLLWDFGACSGMPDRGKFELVSGQLSQDQTLQDVILLVEQTYYQVLGLQAVVEVNRKSLKDAVTNLAAVQDRRARSI